MRFAKLALVGTTFALMWSNAHADCTTIKECAQEAVEAALTARSQIDLMIPKGAVVPFAADKCPDPYWEEYPRAYGRFIRGIDKREQPVDPDGLRKFES